MNLTTNNYFDIPNRIDYMSVSQYKDFMRCESAALARIQGEYEEEKTTALLVGSYVDAHFSGELDQFTDTNPEILTRSGSLRSEFNQANYIIERVERDEMFMRYISGQAQVIKTGELFGIPWKIKMDSYHPGKAIVDLKVMKDFEPVWVDGQGKIPFVEAWGYDIQGAIYQAIEGNDLPFIVAAVTKEKEPNIGLFSIPQEQLDMAMEIVKSNINRVIAVKSGQAEPVRCERCNYCKRTKKLAQIVSYLEV